MPAGMGGPGGEDAAVAVDDGLDGAALSGAGVVIVPGCDSGSGSKADVPAEPPVGDPASEPTVPGDGGQEPGAAMAVVVADTVAGETAAEVVAAVGSAAAAIDPAVSDPAVPDPAMPDSEMAALEAAVPDAADLRVELHPVPALRPIKVVSATTAALAMLKRATG